MAIHRGIQSAIFFYLSCAPCAEARVRRQRKVDAKRDRLERLALEEEMPDLYRHPSPSSTNPHWQTEIEMGPTLVARGKRRTNTNTARLGGNMSGQPSSVDLPPGSSSSTHDSKINLRLYQREDEALWGSHVNLNGTNGSDASGLRRPPRALTREAAMAGSKEYRNPAINDLHPATVTRVTNRDDVLWMMQPVPVAEVMSGKEGAGSIGARSIRSDGGASRRRTPNATPLTNPVSDRVVDQALRLGSPPALGLTRENSSRASNRRPSTSGQRHERNAAPVERDFAFVSSSPKLPAHRRSPPLAPLPDADDSGFITLGGPMLGGTEATSSASRAARRISTTPTFSPQRDLQLDGDRKEISGMSLDNQQSHQSRSPHLQPSVDLGSPRSRPITSDANGRRAARDSNDENYTAKQNTSSSNEHYHSNNDTLRIPGAATSPRLLHSTSLKTLSPTANAGGPPALLHAAIYTTGGSPRASGRQGQKGPFSTPHDEAHGEDDEDLSVTSRASPATASPADEAIFASWQSPEVEMPKWILEHTRREGVKERWSMDL
jgi:hypothetical protein